MRIGGFSASAIPYFTAAAVGLAIVVCEVLAVRYGQEKPFPRATISATADHYPSYLVFRIATECGATLLIMTWILNYFMLHSRCSKAGRFLPQLSVLLGCAGAVALMGSTATLDTGKHNTKWHVRCASSFFLLSIMACLYNTLVCCLIQRISNCFSRGSMIVRYALSALLAVWLYLALFAHSPNKNFGNIVEYTLAFLILGYVILMGYDMRSYKLDYELK